MSTTDIRTFKINDIESLTFNQAAEIALEHIDIKEYDIFFVDFEESFGFSALVFKNEKHIYYVNDYELHHSYIVKEKGKQALKDYYIQRLKNKLFTEAELMDTVKSYADFRNKSNYLHNYWIMQFDYLSIFGIGEKARKEFEEKRKIYKCFCPSCFCYVKKNEVVKRANEILEHLHTEFDKIKSNDEMFREMIGTELANHETCITCDYASALEALGLKFDELTETQQRIVKEELIKQINGYTC